MDHKKEVRYDQQEGKAEEGFEEEDVCVVCLCDPKTIAVKPCLHFCLCGDCAAGMPTSKCPICRGPIKGFLRVGFDDEEDGGDGKAEEKDE